MKKIFKKIQSKAGLRENDEVTDPAIQPGLGMPGPLRVTKRDEGEVKEKGTPRQMGEYRDMETIKAGEGSLSSGYFRREQNHPSHSERPSFTRKWLEDQANIVSGSEQWNSQNSDVSTSTIRPYLAPTGPTSRGSEATTDSETNQTQIQRDRKFSSPTHATVTQPTYDRRFDSSTERLPLKVPDISIQPADYDPFNSTLNLSDPSAPHSASDAGPASPTTAADAFANAVEALKQHQRSLGQRRPALGPVRPPHGPLAPLVANRTADQNQVKEHQLLCKADHRAWFGPRPNDVHCVPCQLCLAADATLFQCRGCALVACLGCKRKVEEVMAVRGAKDGIAG